MRGRLLAVAAILVLAVPGLLLAKGIDLYSLFPNLTLGADPNGADNANVVAAGLTTTTQTLQVHAITDNAVPADYLQGIDIELLVTAPGGVTLDTTVATVYGGSAVNNWGIKSVSVLSNGGDPSMYPLQVKLGAVELDTADAGSPLGPGDYVFATLKFNVSSPGEICAEGTCISDCPATFVTTEANGYTVQVTSGCSSPSVPTLSEWGLILFGVILFGSLVWYLRRRPATASA